MNHHSHTSRTPSFRQAARLTDTTATFRASILAPAASLRRTVLVVAAAVIGCSLTACSTSSDNKADNAVPAATVSASQDAPSADDMADAPVDDSESDTMTVALDKTATWRNGVKAHLSGFARGTSGEFAFPSGEDYLAFSVTVQNDSKSTLDLSMLSLSCTDGAEEVFDTDAGFDGTPSTHLLPGKSQTWKVACVFPKSAKDAQIEVTPSDTSASGWYRTAIFTGQVQ